MHCYACPNRLGRTEMCSQRCWWRASSAHFCTTSEPDLRSRFWKAYKPLHLRQDWEITDMLRIRLENTKHHRHTTLRIKICPSIWTIRKTATRSLGSLSLGTGPCLWERIFGKLCLGGCLTRSSFSSLDLCLSASSLCQVLGLCKRSLSLT